MKGGSDGGDSGREPETKNGDGEADEEKSSEGVHKEPRENISDESQTSETPKVQEVATPQSLPEREDAAEVSETKVSPTQVRNALAGLGDASGSSSSGSGGSGGGGCFIA